MEMSDQAPASRKCAGDGDGEGGAFFRVGGGAELVEQDEGACVGEAGEAVEVDDVGGEGGELGLDGLGVADVGEEGGEDGEAGCGGGDGQAGLGHHGEQGGGFEGDGFAAGVGAADDELAGFGGELEGERDDRPPVARRWLLEQRVAGGVEGEPVGRDGGGHAVVVAGEAGAGEEAVDEGEDARAFDEDVA